MWIALLYIKSERLPKIKGTTCPATRHAKEFSTNYRSVNVIRKGKEQSRGKTKEEWDAFYAAWSAAINSPTRDEYTSRLASTHSFKGISCLRRESLAYIEGKTGELF